MKKNYKKLILLLFILINSSLTFGTIVLIETEDNEFNPAVLTVNVGDTIMWYWHNPAGFHTTTSTSIPPGATAWNAPIDQNNQTFTYVVTAPGNYDYVCIYHSSMGMTGQFTAVSVTSVGEANPGINFNSVYSPGNIHIAGQYAGTVSEIRLLNMQGKTISSSLPQNAGSGKFMADMRTSGMAIGIYIIQIISENGLAARKFYIPE